MRRQWGGGERIELFALAGPRPAGSGSARWHSNFRSILFRRKFPEKKKGQRISSALFPLSLYPLLGTPHEIGVQTALTSVYCSRTSWPISRPQPDSLYPPKGRAASNTL